ncbi:MAG TPA: hypothetical protein VHD87_06850 [Acidimicrobiales bacterium]|nr:hypothetical protein [Acidimicrobiales bacterium]
MGKRLALVFAAVGALLSIAGVSAGHASAATSIGKTGLYKGACGETQVWVDGKKLTPDVDCIPPAPNQ